MKKVGEVILCINNCLAITGGKSKRNVFAIDRVLGLINMDVLYRVSDSVLIDRLFKDACGPSVGSGFWKHFTHVLLIKIQVFFWVRKEYLTQSRCLLNTVSSLNPTLTQGSSSWTLIRSQRIFNLGRVMSAVHRKLASTERVRVAPRHSLARSVTRTGAALRKPRNENT